ncbi:MAG TPA: MFS transporter [Patescibacteria group bacterium]|jgi:predicted MFS family arabinose efflux permease|nr:MFS transporter [Patescibacteria group bacterium]
MTFSSYVAVLKNRDFAKLWISQLCSQLTNYLLSFVILIRTFELTGSSAAVSLIILAFGLGTVIFGGVAGVYADRFDRKWILTFINFAQAACVALYLLSYEIWALVLITFIYSSLNQFYLPSEAPSIPDLVAPNQILIANSYFAFTGSAALIVGFAAAGPALLAFGPKGVYLSAVTLLILAGLATLSLPSLKPKQTVSMSHPFDQVWHGFKEGLAHFWKNKRLHFPLLSLLSVQIITGMMITIAPAFIEKMIQVKLERNSLLVIAPVGLGILFGSLLLGWETRFLEKSKIVLTGFFGMGFMIFLLSFMPLFPQRMLYYVVVAFFMGVFNAHIFAPSHSSIQTYAADAVRGRIYASLYTLLQICATLPTVIIGVLADRVALVYVVGGLGLTMILLGTWLRTRVERV